MTCFRQYGCSHCGSDYASLWATDEHIFLRVDKVFLCNERGVARECTMKIADPNRPGWMQPTSIGFEGWVVEPHAVKCNMWQFWIKENNEVLGRPCGASASSYRPPGSNKRRKPGEWYATPWVPKDAVKACIELYVKT